MVRGRPNWSLVKQYSLRAHRGYEFVIRQLPEAHSPTLIEQHRFPLSVHLVSVFLLPNGKLMEGIEVPVVTTRTGETVHPRPHGEGWVDDERTDTYTTYYRFQPSGKRRELKDVTAFGRMLSREAECM